MSTYRIVDRLQIDSAAEREALIAGLFATRAAIPPKYFYDDVGCALFCAICELEEYYPTRTEVAIFNEHREQIAAAVGVGGQLVDLGAGDCCKAASWLPYFQPRRYLAVDIARAPINKALSGLAPEFPEIEMLGIVTDFAKRLDLREHLDSSPATFFYPGSSIGNFSPDDALEFVRQIQAHCTVAGSGLLIGVDAKKDRRRLEAAYDDAVGVTAAFNRNVLSHVNALLGSNFHPEAFAHVALYDEQAGRIEMHLEARSEQRVTIRGRERVFAAGERIHTENSYKYAPAEFEALLARAGFDEVRLWQDGDRQFSVFYAR
jgi:dimethylhistidine N-methyltransferase